MNKQEQERKPSHLGDKAHRSPKPSDKGNSALRPLSQIQRAAGNQALSKMLGAGVIKPKLRVSQPGDADEVEADRVAAAVVALPSAPALHRKCACTGGESSCPECEGEEAGQAKGIRRKAKPSDNPDDPVRDDFLPSLGPGQPLDPSVRTYMEPRFGRDFGAVRIHTDAKAAETAQRINALAFTHGNDIVFDVGNYNPASEVGRGILAHELTHVVQQAGRGASEAKSRDAGSLNAHEQQANAEGAAIAAGAGHVQVPSGTCVPAVMRLTPAEFQKQLSATADQKTAIATLFSNTSFLSLWNYLKKCSVTPQNDLGPLSLKVSPGLKISGVERYGGYDPGSQTLEINPTKPEHKANPSELVDTITHELIHAVDDLADKCKKAGAGTAPLAGAATSTAPSRASVAGTAQEKQLMTDQGPGASNPCEEFLDINKAAQQMVIQIIRENIKVAKVGRPTVTFVNEILRQDPKAMAAYIACRDAACAKSKPEDRQKAMAACSADIIAKFMPKSLAP